MNARRTLAFATIAIMLSAALTDAASSHASPAFSPSPRGVLYSSGPSYGVDVTLTVSPKGRITAVSVAGFSSDGTVEATTAWGACKMEGGSLA